MVDLMVGKEENCGDAKCFIHGDVKVRGQVLIGTVVSTKAKKTAIVERQRMIYIPKYKRYARTRSRYAAHNPPCINAKVGDKVKIGECRKLSRTKTWTIIEIIGKDKNL
ncbi:MAG: 30S ribosomal protein S17 [Candidatus Micrarchaeia archaeon]